MNFERLLKKDMSFTSVLTTLSVMCLILSLLPKGRPKGRSGNMVTVGVRLGWIVDTTTKS